MSKLIKDPEQLPEWFLLENYDALQELTTNEFVEQLMCRIFVLSTLKDGEEPESCERFTAQIMSGSIILEESAYLKADGNDLYSEEEPSKGLDEFNISGDDIVYPMDYATLQMYDSEARDLGVYSSGEERGSSQPELMTSPVPPLVSEEQLDGLLEEERRAAQKLPLVVELGSGTDEEIISSISRQLPSWRKAMNAPEPELSQVRAGMKAVSKLLKDKVIPMMDLMAWKYLMGVKISDALLAKVLFPDGSKGFTHVAQTLRPRLNVVMGDGYRRSLQTFLNQNPHVGRDKVSSYMGMEV